MLETEPKLIKHRGGDILHENVGELRCRRDMEDTDMTDDNLLSDEIKINLHMLRALIPKGLVERYTVLMLSQYMRVQRDGGAWISCKSWRNQVAVTPRVSNLYDYVNHVFERY
jgi:hypothetical protein